MRCWTARLNTVGLLCASVLRTWIFAHLITLSLHFKNSVTLASFPQQRADRSSFKTTMSPTLMDCSIAPVLFRWYSRNPKRYSLRHCLVEPSSNLKWYLSLFVNDWDILMTLRCLWCGMVAIWRPYRKILKISLGAYIFQRPLLRGSFLEGLIFGGAYLRSEICVSKSIGLAL